jgi:hypothetical protein
MNASDAHARVMHEIERTERHYKMAFFAAVAFEAALLGALLLLTNVQDRTQLLLLAGFVGSYTIIVLALVALGVHVSRVGQRIVRAIAESTSRS